MNALYRHRESASWLTTGAVLLGIAGMSLPKSMKPAPPPPERGMEIRMFEEPAAALEEPQPAKPIEKSPPPPRQRVVPPPPQAFTPTSVGGELPPVLPAPAVSPVTAPVTPPRPAQASVAAQPVAAKPMATVSGDDIYISRLRTYVLSRKKYPSGRDASLVKPVGTVRAWIVLDRQGGVRESGIEQSADSIILDNAALKLLRSGSYPVFPDEAFAGQATHRFMFDLEYKLSSSS